MPKQSGPVTLSGSIGNINFYNDQDGKPLARRRAGPSPEALKSSNYIGFRLKRAEFTRSSSIASKISKNFIRFQPTVMDGSWFNRLTSLAKAISVTDYESLLGSRHPIKGNIWLLEGYQFNKKRLLDQILRVDSSWFDAGDSGMLQLRFASFNPRRDIDWPQGATHCQIITIAADLDRDNGSGKLIPASTSTGKLTNKPSVLAASELLPLVDGEMGSFCLELDFRPEKDALQIYATGIIFYEFKKGFPKSLRKQGALEIVRVEMTDIDGNKLERKHTTERMREKMMEYSPVETPKDFPISDPATIQAWEIAAKQDALRLWQSNINQYRRG
jgi:hypothetical protein